MEPYELTIAQASALIAAGELSPVALMESLLGRIHRLEPGLKAWVPRFAAWLEGPLSIALRQWSAFVA